MLAFPEFKRLFIDLKTDENLKFLSSATVIKTIFTFVFLKANESSDTRVSPDMITCMSDAAAKKPTIYNRENWIQQYKQGLHSNDRWMAPNTRETVRKDAIKKALIPYGLCLSDETIPTNSPKPRYNLSDDFFSLLNNINITSKKLADYLHKTITMKNKASVILKNKDGILIDLPNGERRLLEYSNSTILLSKYITHHKQSLNQFTPLFISDQKEKVAHVDRDRSSEFGITVNDHKIIPDGIFAHLSNAGNPVISFIEIVDSCGPITETRKQELLKLVSDESISEIEIRFVTVFENRKTMFKKFIPDIAWGTDVWISNNPDNLIRLI